ncbi:MAG TPA: YceI family protein [Tepidiformaceae bacterium]|nr:YceI family protein [Tepidiformaceae bacterium]
MVRRVLFLGLPALIAVVLAVGGGWWLFVREDNELAEAAPEIPQDLRTQTAVPASTHPASDSDGQAFTILADRSEAAYFADEKLARLSVPSTAKGTTRQISGEFHLTPTGLDLAHESTFAVDLRSLKSDESMRDRRVQTALETSRFPEATFVAKSVSGPIESLNETTDTDLKLTGILTIKGVEREVTWDVKAKRDGNVLTALATVNFRYADFGVPVLNIGGFVSVEEDVTLQVQITAQAP